MRGSDGRNILAPQLPLELGKQFQRVVAKNLAADSQSMIFAQLATLDFLGQRLGLGQHRVTQVQRRFDMYNLHASRVGQVDRAVADIFVRVVANLLVAGDASHDMDFAARAEAGLGSASK